MDTTDLDLVKRTQLGDRHAFDLLVIKYQRRIAYVISRYIKSPQQVEEVTQEAFVNAYRGILTFQGKSQFSTWLHRIGVNAAKNHLSAERVRLSLYEPSYNVETNELIEPVIIDTEDPERLLIAKQLAESISNALKTLPKDLCQAITLREINGMSYSEIAVVMKCPLGTVRSRISRAREIMTDSLRPLLEPHRDRRAR
ncbi:MAG: sigma-70 family RNA polymerase sigma factor [Nitrosospira sp.]|nr:sigma-70 family RNA polymerase sigma factor [Nitrosospira sp.]